MAEQTTEPSVTTPAPTPEPPKPTRNPGCPTVCAGEDDCCSAECPCLGEGEGDCDTSADCGPGLICGTNNCEGAGFDALDDCCMAEQTTEPSVTTPDDCQKGYPLGSCYSGSVATTASGRTCAKWSTAPQSQWPRFDHNFCRNPSGNVNGTWCYTADPAMPWETCGLPRCHEPVSGYCSVSAPCGEGQGDCNYNAQCKGSLICGTDNCDGAYASTDDCCYDPATHTGSEVGVRDGSFSNTICQPKDLQCRNIPSLGMPIKLGDGWNARTGQPVVGLSPWQSTTVESKQVTTENQLRSVKFQQEEDSRDRAKSLGVSASMALNVFSGLVTVTASGEYLKKEKESSTSIRFALDFDSKAHFTDIPWDAVDVDSSTFCSKVLEGTEGLPTHVITEVQFGTKAFILAEKEVRTGENSEEVKVNLEASVRYGVVSVDLKTGFDKSVASNFDSKSINVQFLGNTNNVKIPHTIEDIDQTVNDLEKASLDFPQPVSFGVTRISEICTANDVLGTKVDSDILEQLVDIFTWIGNAKLRVTTMENKPFAKSKAIKDALTDFYDLFLEQETKFKKDVKEALLSVRSDPSVSEQVLRNIADDWEKSMFSETKATRFLDYFERSLEELETYAPANSNIMAEEENEDKQQACRRLGTKNTFVFYVDVIPDNIADFSNNYFNGQLDMNQYWIPNDFPTNLWAQFKDLAAKANRDQNCFVVQARLASGGSKASVKLIRKSGKESTSTSSMPIAPGTQFEDKDSSCYWTRSWNWNQEASCRSDEVATGACAGGGKKDCHDSSVHGLRCCKSMFGDIQRRDDQCWTVNSGYGDDASCVDGQGNGSPVAKSCSGGRFRDCNYSGGHWDSNFVRCCPLVNDGDALAFSQCGNNWKFGGYGEDLYCDDNEVVVARCGGGWRKDCPNGSSHAIRCCKLYFS